MNFLEKDAFKELRQILVLQGRDCLLLAGAGLTIACKGDWTDADYADPGSWAGLLRNGAQFIARNIDRTAGETIIATLDAFVAEPDGPAKDAKGAELYPRLGTQVWSMIEANGRTGEWLAGSIGALQTSAAGKALLDHINQLRAGGVIITTTNYENFLAEACQAEQTTWRDATRMRAVFAGTAPDCIAHIHGHFSEPDSIVLTDGQYAKLVKTRDAAMTAEKMAAIYRHWIYIGCGAGLGDPNFRRVLQWQAAYLPPEHQRSGFFIGTEKDWNAARTLPGFDKINVKHIPLSNYAELGAVLAELAGAVSIAPIEQFDPATPAIAARLRSRPDDRDEIKPHWDELAPGSTLPRGEGFAEMEQELAAGRAVLIKDSAGVGKSITAMQLARVAQLAGAKVHWLELGSGMTLRTYVESWLVSYDGLLVLDEAHTNPELALKIALIAAEANPKLRIIALFTSGAANSDTVTIGWDALLAQLKAAGLVQRSFSLRPGQDFYARLAVHLLGRLGRSALASLIEPDWAQAWQDEYRRQVLLFCAAFLGSRQNFTAQWDGAVPRAMALDWINDRFALRKLPAQARENLAYLARVGRLKDTRYGWVPKLALPHPGVLPDGAARDLLLDTWRASIDCKLYRLVQSDALGEILETALGEEAKDKAGQHDLTAPNALAGRLLIAPELIRPLAEERGLSVAQAFEPMRTYAFEFDQRLQHVSMRTFATVLTYLYNTDRSLARELIEQRAPDWFEVASLEQRSTMDGAGSLANMLFKCGQSNTDQHHSDYAVQAANVATAVIRRASPERDFLTYPFNLKHLAEVLRSLPKDEAGVGHFMDVVWTPRFILTNLGLAKEKLGFSEVIGNAGLGTNLAAAEAVRSAGLESTYTGVAVSAIKGLKGGRDMPGLRFVLQTLGTIYLLGSRSGDFLARNRDISAGLAKVDVEQLGHALGRGWLEPDHLPDQGRYQTKDWLGLRAALELAGGWIPISREIVQARRDRWKAANDASTDPDGLETPSAIVAASMIDWLDRALAAGGSDRVRLDATDMGLRTLRDRIWDLPCRQRGAAGSATPRPVGPGGGLG